VRPRSREQRGYATVWAVGWIAVLGAVAWAGVLLALAVAHQHRLDGSADLVALSAAQALQRGGDACATAKEVASASHVRLATCTRDEWDVTVHVTERLELPLGLAVMIDGSARAGPS
jgi:secretion/DNA translocation related TadE-like protein